MNPGDDNFDKVRRLLAWKRHEAPPPGFFAAFPERVRARICQPARAPAASWWERLWAGDLWRPALAGACALAAGGLLIWQFNAGARPPGPGPGLVRQELPKLGSGASLESPRGVFQRQLPDTLAGFGQSSGEPDSSMAPRGLFAPGAGLRGPLTPASVTGHPPALTVTGVNLGGPEAR
jgi:hypothetical protein